MADKKEFEIDGKALSTLRVVDLKQELDKRGLSKSGSKKELADRLKVQLQLEKLHESASTDEGHVPNLKLQDEMVEQNDLIKDYLAQQQQIYAVQKENRRRVELEEQRTRDSEASAGDTSQEEEEVEQTAAKVEEAAAAAAPSPPREEVVQEVAEDLRSTRGRRSSGAPAKVDAEVTVQRERRSRNRSSEGSKLQKAVAEEPPPSPPPPVTQDDTKELDVFPKPDGVGVKVDTQEPALPPKGSESLSGGADKAKDVGEIAAVIEKQSTMIERELVAEPPPKPAVEPAVTEDAVSPPTKVESNASPEQETPSGSSSSPREMDQDATTVGTATPAASAEQPAGKQRPKLRRLGSQPAEESRRGRSSVTAAAPETAPEDAGRRGGRDSTDPPAKRSASPIALSAEDKKGHGSGEPGGTRDVDAKEEQRDRHTSEDQGPGAAEEKKKKKTTMGTKTEDLGDASVARARDEPADEPAKGDSRSHSRASSGSRSPALGRRRSRQSGSGRSSASGSSSSSSSRSRERRGPQAGRSDSSSGSDSRSGSRSVSPVSTNTDLKDNDSRMDVKDNDESARSSPPRVQQPEPMETGGQDRTSEPVDESSSSSVTAVRRRSGGSSEKVAEKVARVKEEPAKVSSRKISISSLKDKQSKKEDADDGDGETKPLQRKRRWGGGGGSTAGSKKISLSINTDSLKDLIPDVKPPSALIAETSMDNHSEGELEESDSPDAGVAVASQEKKPAEDGDGPEPLPTPAAVDAPSEEATAVKRDPPPSKREIKPPSKDEPKTTKREPVIFRTVTQVVKDKGQSAIPETRVFGNRIVPSLNDADLVAARRSPSPARFPPSQYLHIKNLVRPFTLNQLKELLSKTGTLVEGQFWIDKIKSKCYVMYELEEQAVATRQCLHGISWPSSNPKRLMVDFSNKDELDYHCQLTDAVDVKRNVDPRGQVVVKEDVRGRAQTTAAATAAATGRSRPGAPEAGAEAPERARRDSRREPLRPSQDQAANRMDRHRRLGAKDDRPEEDGGGGGGGGLKPPVREWDKDKIGERSPGERARASRQRNRQLSFSRSRSRSPRARKTSPLHPLPPGGREGAAAAARKGERDRNRVPAAREHRGDKRAERHREEEAPAKLLDDLFHKTKTTPCIYWLPLTVEQIKLQVEQRQQRRQQVLELEKKNRVGGASGGNAVEQAVKKPRDMDGNRNRRRSGSQSRSRGRKR